MHHDTAELMATQLSPFSVLLLSDDESEPTAAQTSKEELLADLPASYLTESYDLVAPSRSIATYIEKELDVKRLNRIQLGAAGDPIPPRPLHFQLLLGRKICITEQLDMHMVWRTRQIFLKPIPRLLLVPHFWIEYLSCETGCDCSKEAEPGARGTSTECERRKLWKCALGFLFSYAALISTESDFHIAKERRLLPAEDAVTWRKWRALVEQLDTENIYPKIDKRFFYGELNLPTLNYFNFLTHRPFLLGFVPHWSEDRYVTFVGDHFATLASVAVFIALVLAGLQVGLGVKALSENGAFQSAAYGFTVFSLLFPLAAVVWIFVNLGILFAHRWMAMPKFAFERKRLKHIKAGMGTA
ncbi:Uncharacterized protein TPAR_01907 [Tolypocladium paradoxum]|uniref:Subtilisin-like serine protease n=1 Tax=Tolypocladium paradoxum TaxID=94208 RepID=A0A2S4L627_9HYPO|nr:Uncharacterized protein TPAR_01907 [Tolypocladium paradoxum]